MTHLPLVSIGVPVYNGEQCIKNALESLATQSYRNLEIIISDNASTDRTAEMCREYAARDQRVRYRRNFRNIGLTANFRHVRDLATGEFFMWACADDIRPPNAVDELVAALLKNPHAVMAHGPVIAKARECETKFSNEMDLSSASAAERVRIFTKRIGHNSMLYGLYKRPMLARAGFGNHYGQDYLLCLQMCLMGPVVHVESPMIVYKEKTPRPIPDPMGVERPLKVLDLLRGGVSYKCLKVLVFGCYYVLSAKEVSAIQRIVAVSAFISTFAVKYRQRLGKDIAFLMSSPLAGFCSVSWKLAKRAPGLAQLGERLKAVFTRA